MPKKSRATFLRGTVSAFNLSPKGQIEGVMLDTGDGTVQVNFPKAEADALAQSMRVGSQVDLYGELETDESAHRVYSVTKRGEDSGIGGRVVQLNYARHGEVNGFHLDDGTFVHLKPEGAKKHRIHVGEMVRAKGIWRSGDTAPVLEATTVERIGKPSERAQA